MLIDSDNLILKLESMPISSRIDFIEDSEALREDKNREVVLNFLLESKMSANYWYHVVLIELAEELELKDDKLLKKFKSDLMKSNHYLHKLSILDYFDSVYDKSESGSFSFLEECLITRNRKIVSNQIILLIMKFFDKKESYFKLLKRNLRQTNDYRCHVRVYNFINSHGNLFTIAEKQDLIEISRGLQLGKAVEEAINRVLP